MAEQSTTSQFLIASGSVEVKVNGKLLITANIGISTVITNSFMGVKKMMDKKLSPGKNEHKMSEAVRPLQGDDWCGQLNTKINSLCISFKLQNNIRTFGKFATRSSRIIMR